MDINGIIYTTGKDWLERMVKIGENFILKKWVLRIGFSTMLVLLVCPIMALARVGGSTGGNGSGGNGETSTEPYLSNTYDRSYDDYDRRGYYGRHDNSPIGLIIGSVIVVLSFVPVFGRTRRQYRFDRVHPDNVMLLSADIQAEFEPLFYQVEAAWTTNDLQTLQNVMAPRYFRKQRRILKRYAKQHKCAQLEGLVILELGQVRTKFSKQLKIVVTAQARDYFQYDNQSAAYNKNLYENAYIERFTEVWELRQTNNKLVVLNIRQ